MPNLAAVNVDEYEYISDCSKGGVGCVAKLTGCRQGDKTHSVQNYSNYGVFFSVFSPRPPPLFFGEGFRYRKHSATSLTYFYHPHL